MPLLFSSSVFNFFYLLCYMKKPSPMLADYLR
jgi:hypothetical protein